MTYIPIETRIRQYYVAEDGEWLVEKGKVKEAKMLKEACEVLEDLRKSYNTYYGKLGELSKRERAVKKREEAVSGLEGQLVNRLEQTKQSLDFMIEGLKKTNG